MFASVCVSVKHCFQKNTLIERERDREGDRKYSVAMQVDFKVRMSQTTKLYRR